MSLFGDNLLVVAYGMKPSSRVRQSCRQYV